MTTPFNPAQKYNPDNLSRVTEEDLEFIRRAASPSAPSPYLNFPEALRRDDVRAWVLWKLEKRDGKMTKVPYDAKNGQPAEADNPETWTSLRSRTGSL